MDADMLARMFEELARDMRRTSEPSFLGSLSPDVVLRGWTFATRTVASLEGFAVGHPVLGTKMIQTSELYFLSEDRSLARTLSRWYRLTEPASIIRSSSLAAH